MFKILSDGICVLIKNWDIILTILTLILSGPSLIFLLSSKVKKENLLRYTPLFFFFILSLLLRLAFIRGLFSPPYFDSVEHFRIIKLMIAGLKSSTFSDVLLELLQNYYHLGFHFLASLLAFGLRAGPTEVVLIFGQIALTMLPVPIYFLVQRETDSQIAAFFSAILSGFGWYMPGFALNWGKYPALVGILAFEIVLCTAYIFSQKKIHPNKQSFILFLIIGIFTATLIHSRVAVLFFIAFSSYIFAKKIGDFPKEIHHQILRIFLSLIFIFGFLVSKEPLLKLALEPYFINGISVTLTIFFLSYFAFKKHPLGFYFNAIFIFLLFLSLFIPIALPGFGKQSLLDRPFVEMILYFPLSILAGLGLDGALKSLKESTDIPNIARTASILIIGITGLYTLTHYSFYQSTCCSLLEYDDTVAFEWMDKNLPPDAHVLVAGNHLNVHPSTTGDLVGSDAGIWIPQLTGRKITMLSYDLEFLSAEKTSILCQRQIDYVYVGNKMQSFNRIKFIERKEIYKEVLSLPNIQLYQLQGCSPTKLPTIS